MAIRTLFNVMKTFSSGKDPNNIRNNAGVRRDQTGGGSYNIRTSRVVAIGDNLTMVQHQGRIVRASQATDEPLRAGQGVWVSPVKGGGLVVHGSRK